MKKKELFVVEGQSAEHALVLAMDKKTQFVHAVQGKLANVRNMPSAAVESNLECQKLINTLGGEFTTGCSVNKLPFARVIVLMDPDIDGVHSSALLLSFFARYCQPIVAEGLLSIVKPPLFRVSSGTAKPVYAWSEDELQHVLNARNNLHSHINKSDVLTTRFKGIAQFSVEECYLLLLNPSTRRQQTLTG